MKHIFILGSRGLPAKYGGFETFVQALIDNQNSKNITYHVACLSDDSHHRHFKYQQADCFTIKVPKLGPARVIAYDLMALDYAIKYCKQNRIASPIFYMLGNTIGPFIRFYRKRIARLSGKFYVNPDGLEWRRSKWSQPVQVYLKYAEKKMAQKADLIVADNSGIESYIKKAYPVAKTTFIAYGTDLAPAKLTKDSDEVRTFFQKWGITEDNYYLVVGRFVPENNYETVIREFMTTKTKRDLVIICNHEGNAYFEELRQKTGFDKDARVKFVGTVYDKDLLKFIRQSAFAYLHGHEVGGTNPGLLEALAASDLSLILDVDFNHLVAQDTALYWTKDQGSLCHLIDKIDVRDDFSAYGQKAKKNMSDNYTWHKIVGEYEDLFLNES